MGTYRNGDVFEVEITGLESPVNYTVTFFDLDPITGLSFENNTKTVTDGSYGANVNVQIQPSDADGVILYTSSDPSIAEISEYGQLQIKKTGTITVTASYGDITAQCTVVIEHDKGDGPDCERDQVCEECGEVLQKALGHDYKESVIAPTTARGGYTLHTCTRCGDSYKDQITEPLKAGTEGIVPSTVTLKKGTTFQSGKLKYKITSYTSSKKQVQVIGTVKKTDTSLAIPATVKYKNATFTVTSIGSGACAGLKKLRTVTLGKNISVVYSSAFSGCSALTKFTSGSGLKEIQTKAFYNCKKLNALWIKSTGLKKVGSNAFKNISARAVAHVPGSKYTAYKKLLSGKGQKITVKK